jgi:predicted DNA-binding transcriptional regulator YafY
MGNTTNEKQWAAMERLCFIERAAYWRGWVNRQDLMAMFGLSPAQASADFQKFQELNADALTYNLNQKRYEGSPTMTCRLHEPRIEEAMALFLPLGSATSKNASQPPMPVDQPSVALVTLPVRMASVTVQRAVFRAVLQGLRLRVDYQTMSGKAPAGRWIMPHAFGHDGYRWHVRAWSEGGEHWGDFVLSRIRSAEWPTEAAAVLADEDEDWQTWVDLALVPNLELSDEQQETIKTDYAMRGGKLKLRVRRAMLDYTLAHLRLPMTSGNDFVPLLSRLET